MRDFVKRDLAMQIKTDLSKFSVNILTEYAFEVVDDVFRKFCQLNNIGVYITGNGADNIIYHFVKDNGYSVSPRWGDTITEVRDARLFVSLTANHDWNAMVTRAISNVERRFHFKPWQSYLYDSDWDPMRPSRIPMKSTLHDDGVDAIRYSINSIVPRTGGPGREALERMLRTSQYDVDVAGMYPKFSDNILNYMKKDVESTMNLYKRLEKEKKNAPINWNIKKVIFHDPATIIYWNDGTKTVVKTQNGEKFDPEKGMAMAICKKANCNDSIYYEAFKEFLPKEEKESFEFSFDLPEGVDEPTEDNIETPMNLEESTDTITIDTEAEQYTGEAPKEVSDDGIEINMALAAFVEYVGCLEALYDPERSMYHIRDKNHIEKAPYVLAVDSPIAEISPTALAQLKLDICKYFDI